MSNADTKAPPSTLLFYLYLSPDGRPLIGPARKGGQLPAQQQDILAGPIAATSWVEARQLLRAEIARQQKRLKSDDEPDVPQGDPVFKSAHEALTFAFRFTGQQSPKTPMQMLMQQAEPLGSGRGLSGLDGAGQAGMVLAALRHLNADQRHVVVARYGDIRRPCPCCGQPTASQDWREAVEALSNCAELRDLPKQVRHAAIEKAVCRRKLRLGDYAVEYGLSARTLRHKLKEVKERYAVVENSAVGFLEDFFEGRGVLIKE